jgi:hypothetical protein
MILFSRSLEENVFNKWEYPKMSSWHPLEVASCLKKIADTFKQYLNYYPVQIRPRRKEIGFAQKMAPWILPFS